MSQRAAMTQLSDESQRAVPSLASLRWAGFDAVGLTVLALGAACFRLGSKSVVMDEAGSVLTARMPFAAFARQLAGEDPNMGLYYTLLRVWIGVAGESAAAARLPSAVFGALTVGATYLLGRRLFGRTAGVVAALLLTCNVFLLEFAQTARAYTLFALLVVVASHYFAELLAAPSRRARIGYVVAMVLAVYAHYFAAYVLLAHAVFVAAWGSQRRRWREWLLTAAAIVAASLPAVAFALRSGRRLGWISPATLADVPQLFLTFSGQSRAATAILIAAAGFAVASAIRSARAWPECFVATWLVVPILASFLVSQIAPMFEPNYLIFCLPALMLLAAAGIARLRPRVAIAAVLAVVLLLSARRAMTYYDRPAIQDWRAATGWVLADQRPADGVAFFVDSGRKPFEYYLRQAGAAGPTVLTTAALDARERVWFVIRKSDLAGPQRPEFDAWQGALQARFRHVERRDFGWVAVELYAR